MRGIPRLRGPRSSASATAGAERILVVVGSAVRLSPLVEMLPSGKAAYDASAHPPLALSTWVVAGVATVLFLARAATRRGPLGGWEVGVDAGVATALLVAGVWAVPVDQRIGSWVGFESGYALGVVVATSSCTSLRAWLLGVTAVLVGKTVYLWSALSWSVASTAIGDYLTVTVLGAISVVLARFIRGLAHEADLARAAAAADEARRASAAFHNGLAVLGLLAQPDLDPEIRLAIQSQARVEVHRVRTYLCGEHAPTMVADDGGALPLAAVICAAVQPFPDVAPQLMLDLVGDVRVPSRVAVALERALTSVLLNVRLHAHASATVVHADHEDGVWTVTVHDNGVGFDPAVTDLGVGLAQVVVAALADHGVRTAIDSVPGLGTTLKLTGVCDDQCGPH